jgi:hypothetical protein
MTLAYAVALAVAALPFRGDVSVYAHAVSCYNTLDYAGFGFPEFHQAYAKAVFS